MLHGAKSLCREELFADLFWPFPHVTLKLLVNVQLQQWSYSGLHILGKKTGE